MNKLSAAVFSFVLAATAPAWAQSGGTPIRIVAAENFYGDVARQLGGGGAAITSIMSSPDEDPHLFEASPSVARAISGAGIVVWNGADYDPWMAKLLASSRAKRRQVIDVGGLLHVKPGANPHLWYDPATMPALARVLAAALSADDPSGRAGYERRLDAFLASLAPLDATIARMRRKFAGTPVTATEPVFGYMAAALGLKILDERFQLAVMNDTEPSASDTAAFEDHLRSHAVRALLYNSQATDSAARRLLRIAKEAGVPVVGVTETEPAGHIYQAWMLDQLKA
ncbi:MAG: zinc ABC transporter substrate-binding protein, partial [Pseudomonadota bacterium]|nr:zinc ABC transporter substrate-binding protein [Pseudomonadota bacterium]